MTFLPLILAFSAWMLLTRPALFSGYVIVSPSLWYDDEMIFEVEGSPKARAYIAAGSIENPIMACTAKRCGKPWVHSSQCIRPVRVGRAGMISPLAKMHCEPSNCEL